MMSTRIFRASVIGVWFTIFASVVAWSVTGGMSITPSTAVFLVSLALAPPAILSALWQGAPPQTMAEVLYDVDRRA